MEDAVKCCQSFQEKKEASRQVKKELKLLVDMAMTGKKIAWVINLV